MRRSLSRWACAVGALACLQVRAGEVSAEDRAQALSSAAGRFQAVEKGEAQAAEEVASFLAASAMPLSAERVRARFGHAAAAAKSAHGTQQLLISAREHLARAVLLAPPAEGASFDSPAQPTPGSAVPVETSAAALEARQELSLAREALRAARPDSGASRAWLHELSGMVELTAQDATVAEREFAAAVREPLAPQDRVGAAIRARASLQLARLAYARGDDAQAQALYARVSSDAPEWLDALFEASWAHFRSGHDEKTLGNLVTLDAPFFVGRSFPEGQILRALVFLQNCRTADARKALADFEAKARPEFEALSRSLRALDSDSRAAHAALTLPAEPRERAAIEAALTGPLGAEASAARQGEAELAILRAPPEGFAGSDLRSFLVGELQRDQAQRLARLGRGLRAELAMARAELRELLAQDLRLGFELAGEEKGFALDRAQGRPVLQSRTAADRRPTLDDDDELWPFQGEYWRDELGNYQYTLGSRCAPGQRIEGARRPSPPPATAQARPSGPVAESR